MLAEEEVNYENRLCLAPMVRVGTLPMRMVAIQYGGPETLVWTPETIDKAIIGAERVYQKTTGRIDYIKSGRLILTLHPFEKSRVIFQMGTADPELALQAALTVKQDVAGVDVNCGCPKKFSIQGGMGAALLTSPTLLQRILTNLVQKSGLPVTCKIRLLETREQTLELVRMIESTGVRALAVHLRTRDQRSSTKAHWSELRAIVEAVRIPVIANGDVFKYEDVMKLKEVSGCSSVMIARGAQANPSVFSSEGLVPFETVIREYCKKCIELDNPYQNTKYCLLQMFNDTGHTKEPEYYSLQKVKSLQEIAELLGLVEYYHKAKAEQETRINAVDLNLINHPTPPSTPTRHSGEKRKRGPEDGNEDENNRGRDGEFSGAIKGSGNDQGGSNFSHDKEESELSKRARHLSGDLIDDITMGSATELEKETIEIGIIGMGDMGRLYAKRIYAGGWKHVNVCDLPSKYETLISEFEGTGIHVFRDGHLVSRRSDYIIYSVEAEHIDKVVKEYGGSTKLNAIVGGQTSVKSPEVQAFEKYLPPDVHIVLPHSMHGPGVNTKGQPLVMIRHRASQEKFNLACRILSCLESEYVFLTAEEHDRITADTQAVTHAAFLSMGTAWKANNQYPWAENQYIGGIENVKVNVALRIYSNKWHVYAGLAIMNPSAKIQINQYAHSVTELFKLMIQERADDFRDRVMKAGEFVFGKSNANREPILLSDSLLDQYSLSIVPKEKRMPNSHLSLLAMADCWYQLGISPYEHMVCQTPLFRLWMGITEYLFRSPQMLEDTIHAALHNREIRADDMEFMTAARGWSECVDLGNMEGYRKRFEETADFFRDRFAESSILGNKMIAMITKKTHGTS